MEKILNQVRAAIFGHAIADAIGVPVEFSSRDRRNADPVTDYRGHGTYDQPAGTWSDDTSMTLAALDSLTRGLDYEDMMCRFCDWEENAAYTAGDETFDIGVTTSQALYNYQRGKPAMECGLKDASSNGNGSLMRIIPAILYCKYMLPDAGMEKHIEIIHNVSALTHAHLRSTVGCGIYYFVLTELFDNPSKTAVYIGLQKAAAFYKECDEYSTYARLLDGDIAALPEDKISSSGYVTATLEAAVWCLLTTDSYTECLLKAVNLGSDTDTVGAVAGGLAGVLYGFESIREDWVNRLIRHEMIEELCEKFVEAIA